MSIQELIEKNSDWISPPDQADRVLRQFAIELLEMVNAEGKEMACGDTYEDYRGMAIDKALEELRK